MPSADDKKNLARLQAGVQFDATLKLVAQLPPFPEDVKQRFPSLLQYEQNLKDWHQQLLIALKGGLP